MSSDPIEEGMEPVSAELSAFYARHSTTGTPSERELQHTWLVVESNAKDESAASMTKRRFPPEWLAAAAVIGVVVVTQLVLMAFQSTEPAPAVARDAVSLDGGIEAAERAVAADACARNAMTAHKAKQFEAAVRVLEGCIQRWPEQAVSYRLLGSAEASIAARDNSIEHRERARRAFEHFVELAAPDDESLPKVLSILEAAKEAPSVREIRADDQRRVLGASKCITQAVGLGAERLEASVEALERCVEEWPEQPAPYFSLGLTEFAVWRRDDSAEHQERARRAFEQFLQLAEPNDPSIDTATSMLELTK